MKSSRAGTCTVMQNGPGTFTVSSVDQYASMSASIVVGDGRQGLFAPLLRVKVAELGAPVEALPQRGWVGGSDCVTPMCGGAFSK